MITYAMIKKLPMQEEESSKEKLQKLYDTRKKMILWHILKKCAEMINMQCSILRFIGLINIKEFIAYFYTL